MAFLDQFNAWYNKAIPDSQDEPWLWWDEPRQGSRYRWKMNRARLWLVWCVIAVIGLLPLPGKGGRGPVPLPGRLIGASVMICLVGIAGWVGSYTKTRIALNPKLVLVGSGRYKTRLALDANTVLCLEDIDSMHSIVFLKNGREELRVFFDSGNESEVLAYLSKHGLTDPIESARTQNQSSKPTIAEGQCN